HRSIERAVAHGFLRILRRREEPSHLVQSTHMLRSNRRHKIRVGRFILGQINTLNLIKPRPGSTDIHDETPDEDQRSWAPTCTRGDLASSPSSGSDLRDNHRSRYGSIPGSP